MKDKRINQESYDFQEGLYHYLNIAVWCEECSTPEHPIMMGEGTCPSFKCPICKKEVMVLANPVFNFGSHYSAGCDKCRSEERRVGKEC